MLPHTVTAYCLALHCQFDVLASPRISVMHVSWNPRGRGGLHKRPHECRMEVNADLFAGET